jgi:hypothetical protein
MFTTKNTTWSKTFNKNEIKTTIESFQMTNQDYQMNLLDYLKKWNRSLSTGKSVLDIYNSLLNDTHILMIQEQWLPTFSVTERPIPLSNTLNCSNPIYSKFLYGTQRNSSTKIVDILMFGYELLLLEIRLYELYDVVDEIIIFESNVTFKKLPKELFFSKNIQRFTKFLEKITLITPFNITRFNNDGSVKIKIEIHNDDILEEFKTTQPVDLSHEKNFYKADYEFEKKCRMVPVQMFQKYIQKFDFHDIFIHGDIDEIPDGNFINHFKYCDVNRNLFPFAIWSTFYIYSFNFVFRSDFPSPTDPFSFKYPNILQLKDINNNNFTRLHKGTTLLPQATGCHQ